MPIQTLSPHQLRLTINLATLGFADTTELQSQPLPWIGQERARKAAQFGLSMALPGYNLFVLGEVGSGRSTLLHELTQSVAAARPVPPDLCYLHNFDAPEHPRALRMPTGQGRQLRQLMGNFCRTIQAEIPVRLDGEDFKSESERIQNTYKSEEAKAYASLDAFAEERHFNLYRDAGHLVFTLIGEDGNSLTEAQARALPKERRAEIDLAEQELREAISEFLDKARPMLRVMNEALASLRRQVIKPLLDHELQTIRTSLKKQIKDSVKLGSYLDQVAHDVLENLELFIALDSDDEVRQEALVELLARYRVNVVVDNASLAGAPVIVEDNPNAHALFGSIEYQAEEDVLMTDFTRVRAGSLLKAHGGYLIVHLADLATDEAAWPRMRRFLRTGKVQIEEPGTALMPMAAISMRPEAVDAEVKIILIGSDELYYTLMEADPEVARRFCVKVDFAESFSASADTHRATAVFIARTCHKLGLPQFTAGAAARLLETTHREVDDQSRQSALFAHTENLLAESAMLCRQRGGPLVERDDVEAALAARRMRHDYPEQRLLESIKEGVRLISTQGERIGQLNGLTQIDLGDWRFGLPIRVTARTNAGDEGLLNIAREVEMSGPIHDKGVLILQSYMSALFGHLAPLALNASVVFEQEYSGIEGDSASCAELIALMSSLAGAPLDQGIAVTGALNQHGEVLPVGGLNEKIEGWYRVCLAAGLNGRQGVLIPARNVTHLMLDPAVVAAVEAGQFHVYTADHVLEGLALLAGLSSSSETLTPHAPSDALLARAEQTLNGYRRACQEARPCGLPGGRRTPSA